MLSRWRPGGTETGEECLHAILLPRNRIHFTYGTSQAAELNRQIRQSRKTKNLVDFQFTLSLLALALCLLRPISPDEIIIGNLDASIPDGFVCKLDINCFLTLKSHKKVFESSRFDRLALRNV